MLDVPLEKLPAGCAQDVGSRLVRGGVEKCHHVLQLVAKTVSSARLIKGRTAPDATGKHLIKQPAIDKQIERGSGERT